MRVDPQASRRPPVRWFGGKHRIAPWIISRLPSCHVNYIEVCGGAASVLLQKERSPVETYNDIFGAAVNFFRVLRDHPLELVRAIELTPFAREEYEIHRQETDDELEWARRFWVGCSMSVVKLPYTKSGFSVATKSPGGDASVYKDMEPLLVVAERLKGVQIENMPYQELVPIYDSPNNLFYFDPPYVQEERVAKNQYTYEWGRDQHVEAAEIFRVAQGYVVISGYACDLYADLYESYGWKREDRVTIANGGRERTESLWLSPKTWRALHTDLSDLPLFGGSHGT